MTAEHNRTVARQLTAAHNHHDLARIRELLAPDFQAHIADWPQALTREQYIEGARLAHQAFTDLIFSIEDMIVEDDKVALRITARGKHTGEYLGIPATQREVIWASQAIRRMHDGRIVEEWQINDQATLLKQLRP